MNANPDIDTRTARTLLDCDRELARYFDHLREYPRVNPGREYINGEGKP